MGEIAGGIFHLGAGVESEPHGPRGAAVTGAGGAIGFATAKAFAAAGGKQDDARVHEWDRRLWESWLAMRATVREVEAGLDSLQSETHLEAMQAGDDAEAAVRRQNRALVAVQVAAALVLLGLGSAVSRSIARAVRAQYEPVSSDSGDTSAGARPRRWIAASLHCGAIRPRSRSSSGRWWRA